MSDPTAVRGSGQFRVGGVFGRAFRMFGRHFRLVLLLALIAGAPRLLAFSGGYMAMLQKVVTSGASPAVVVWLRVLLFVLPTVGQWIVLPALAQIFLAPAAVQHWRRRPIRLGATLRMALLRLLPALGATILVALVIGAAGVLIMVTVAAVLRNGIIATIVAWPVALLVGLFLDCVFYAAVAACVVERTGPVKSLVRSAYLTKGHRWRLLGIVLISAFVLIVVSLLNVALTFPLFRYVGSLVLNLALFAVSTLISAVQALVAVAAYHDLRFAREGVDADEIAVVFD